jgi:hypothetical protein
VIGLVVKVQVLLCFASGGHEIIVKDGVPIIEQREGSNES